MYVDVNPVEQHILMKSMIIIVRFGLLTHPEEDYGNVRVYTDNLELVGGAYGPANNYSRHDKQQVEDGVQQIKEWENEDGEREKESFNRN